MRARPAHRFEHRRPCQWLERPNRWVLRHIKALELLGVVMRIASFSLVSWQGPAAPFMAVWLVNTLDAVLLTWCAVLRKDPAYSLLNGFWIVVGLVGMARAGGWLH